MREFDHQLLRLKAALGVTSDQAVAAALGMTKAAFSDRKKRGAFPEDKLRALVTLRPDLLIDPTYVLTGDYLSVAQAKIAANFGGNAHNATEQANTASTPHLPPDEQLLLDAYRGLSPAKKKQLLAELLTGNTGKKPVKAGSGVVVSGSGNRTAGRDFHEKE